MENIPTKALCRRTPTIDDAKKLMESVFVEHFDDSKCFLTGSVAFGEQTKTSDIDVAFPISRKEEILDRVESLGLKTSPSEYTAGVHIDVIVDDSVFTANLLFLHPLDYVVWNRAGKLYRLLPRLSIREQRHAQFESLRALVKTSFALSSTFVTSDNYTEFL